MGKNKRDTKSTKAKQRHKESDQQRRRLASPAPAKHVQPHCQYQGQGELGQPDVPRRLLPRKYRTTPPNTNPPLHHAHCGAHRGISVRPQIPRRCYSWMQKPKAARPLIFLVSPLHSLPRKHKKTLALLQRLAGLIRNHQAITPGHHPLPLLARIQARGN